MTENPSLPLTPSVARTLDTNLVGRLYWPFSNKSRVSITEAWTYSKEEEAIHGRKDHWAIDAANGIGEPVYAPMNGRAFASLQIINERNKDGKIRGYGGGYFVEIVAEDGLRVQLQHLNSVVESIEYHPPLKISDVRWDPFRKTPNGFIIPMGKPVKTGDLIGFQGHSGLSKDVIETPETAGKVPSWDEDHVHIWCGRRDENGNKIKHYDPFNLYGERVESYNKILAEGSLNPMMWKTTPEGKLVFAHR